MEAKSRNGFTLTELMIVVGIVSFLIVMAAIAYRSQIFKGNDARRKGDVARIAIAAEEYEKDNDCYPLPDLVMCDPGTGLRPYLDKVPCDSISKSSYFYDYDDSQCPKWFRIYVALENTSDPDYIANLGPMSAFSYTVSSPNAPDAPIGTSEPVDDGEEIPLSGYYGCFSGSCVPISWNPSRPGPVCDPNYQNATCYERCTEQDNECQTWSP